MNKRNYKTLKDNLNPCSYCRTLSHTLFAVVPGTSFIFHGCLLIYICSFESLQKVMHLVVNTKQHLDYLILNTTKWYYLAFYLTRVCYYSWNTKIMIVVSTFGGWGKIRQSVWNEVIKLLCNCCPRNQSVSVMNQGTSKKQRPIKKKYKVMPVGAKKYQFHISTYGVCMD